MVITDDTLPFAGVDSMDELMSSSDVSQKDNGNQMNANADLGNVNSNTTLVITSSNSILLYAVHLSMDYQTTDPSALHDMPDLEFLQMMCHLLHHLLLGLRSQVP